jgi:hypothetical protein
MKHGCHNHPPYAEGYYAPDRHYFKNGRFEVRNVWIESVGTKECQYDKQTDSACEGCEHKEVKDARTDT